MKLSTLINLNIPVTVRYLRKRISHRQEMFIAQMKGISSYPFDIAGIHLDLYYHTPYHHARAKDFTLGGWDELELLPKWIEKAKESSLIFDVGGFAGIYGILAAKANPDANVYIFEPDAVNAKHILVNAEKNKVGVIIIQAAVSEHKGTVLFSADGSTGSKIVPWGTPTSSVALAAYGSPQLLKIDVEGHEGEVLRGANLSETKTVFIEENAVPLLDGFERTESVGLTAIYEK